MFESHHGRISLEVHGSFAGFYSFTQSLQRDTRSGTVVQLRLMAVASIPAAKADTIAAREKTRRKGNISPQELQRQVY